jgi:hypothetical protein
MRSPIVREQDADGLPGDKSMYCQLCGNESTEGLNFCKRCGTSFTQPAGANPPKKFPLLLTGIFLLIIGQIVTIALAIPMIAVSDLTAKGMGVDALIPLFVLSPVAGVGAAALLIWLLLRLIKIYYQAPGAQPFVERRSMQISAPPESLTSVTEHTTRNFDPALKDRLGSRE